MLSGTEADILNSVARLREATKGQIRREVGFSLDYIGFLCQYLVRRGYLANAFGRYSLARQGIKMLLTEETPKIDRELLKKIAGEVAKEISGELKKTVKGIKIPVTHKGMEIKEVPEEPIKIKNDFDFPIEDESLLLESNIDKIGVNFEREKSDIDKSVELFKATQKRRRRR